MSNNLNIDEKINETNENLDIATEDVNKDEVAMEDDTYNTTNVDGNQNRYDYSTRKVQIFIVMCIIKGLPIYVITGIS